ncbi:hypothetical protein NMY22_g11814 [Coprinellus aureogranulatus]|nr:hypothetical protein NMY22_g11814 [Coprinellus aureogranulatus]
MQGQIEIEAIPRGINQSTAAFAMPSSDVDKPQTNSWTVGYLQELGRSTPEAKLLDIVRNPVVPYQTGIHRNYGDDGAPQPVLKSIASGSYADIYMATMTMDDGTEKLVAVKVFREAHLRKGKVSPEIHKNHLRRKYEVWGRLHHPNIQRLEGLVLTDLLPSPGLVSNYKPLGDLHSFSKLNLPFDRFAMALGIADGLQYLHSEGVVHGDLTPMNILVEEGQDGNAYTPLITDFGKSRVDGHDGYTTNMNTSFIIARPPELLGHDDPNPATNTEVLAFASDVYSFSMLLLWLLTGIEPYSKESKPLFRLTALITDEEQPLRPHPEKYPLIDEPHAFCWPIMEACWKHVPAERISSREAYELLCQRSAESALNPRVLF